MYITEEPAEEVEDTKIRFKYPFLACEILASEVWAICDAFFQYPELLNDLFSYFEGESPLNPLLSNYASRVASVLLLKKLPETIGYMKERKGIIETFLKHVGNASVMEFLLKIIANESTSEGLGILEWLCSTELIPSLVDKFNPENPLDVHENASQALGDIILVSADGSPLIAQLESEEIVKQLFGYILANGRSSSLLHGLTVIIELLRRHGGNYDETTAVDGLPPLLRIIVESLGKFQELLKVDGEVPESKLALQPGVVERLGFYRLKIVEFLVSLFRCNYQSVEEELVKHNVVTSCLELFFAHQWNNFLHSIVEQMVCIILEGVNEQLKTHLLVDAKLIDHICAASEENEEQIKNSKGVRKGYMGHVTLMTRNLLHFASENKNVEEVLAKHEGWGKYLEGSFAKARDLEDQVIGGYMPTDSNYDDDDLDDYDNGMGGFHGYSMGQYSGQELQYGGYEEGEEDYEEGDDDDEEGYEEGDEIQASIDDDEEEARVVAAEVWEEKTIEDPKEGESPEEGSPEGESPKEGESVGDAPTSSEEVPSASAEESASAETKAEEQKDTEEKTTEEKEDDKPEEKAEEKGEEVKAEEKADDAEKSADSTAE